MTEPLAYLNGQFLPASQLQIPVHDAGFMLGVTVAEQLRTFHGRLFRLDQHLQRLANSLHIVQVDAGRSMSELGAAALRLASDNHRLLAAGDDLGLSMFVTPGTYATFAPPGGGTPTVAMHTYPVPFCLWAEKYQRGQSVVVSRHRQVPDDCWPAELKCRSRMHYFLADREADGRQSSARALLTDHDGFVSEASTANVVTYFEGEGLVSPPREKILPGISIAVLAELAATREIPLLYRDLTPMELAGADEVLLTSTSPCLLPVVCCDGRPIGSGEPGPVFRQLLRAWSDLVGVDIQAQAEQFADR